jgi:diguanylate cyclase (GGDEF)-like protein
MPVCCPVSGRLRGPSLWLRPFLLLAALLAAVPAMADVLRLDQTGTGPLGSHASMWEEEGAPLGVEAAMERVRSGAVMHASRVVPAFGIGSRPVWLHFVLDNPAAAAMTRELVAGATWTDRIDVWLVRDGRVLLHREAGDTGLPLAMPVPGVGYVFDLGFEPGMTELYLRAENPDPLLLPVRIMAPAQLAQYERRQHYSYGLVYGFLLALIAYNLLLYAGMRQRSHLNYSLYLGCFVLTNLAYTGHGYVWIWHDFPQVQRYIILVLMVLFGWSGFRFASAFLDLPTHEPRLARLIRTGCAGVLALMALAIALGRQVEAAQLAFSFVMVFTVGMVLLGGNALRKHRISGRYFLLAACSAMTGAAVTNLTVWGLLPYTTLTFRAVELGVLIEATLLALAVAYQVRQHEQARQQAELLARTDPLTGLLNRRAFTDIASGLWNTAQRNGRPLSLILLDLDHFKSINDRYGHAVGDLALRETAQVLANECRQGDLAARWGGEEFMMLLPETTLEQARTLAERLRRQIAGETIMAGRVPVTVRASFGVVDAVMAASLEELMHEADRRLYRAKQGGRDRVCSNLSGDWDGVAPSPR